MSAIHLHARSALIISDLHLDETRPATTAAFFRFLHREAPRAEALFILGDLFEYWVGDDQLDHDPLAREVAEKLAALVGTSGTTVYFMHGNRDFLIGQGFADAARLSIIADPSIVSINNETVLLMHGDTLCTDDVAYQRFRAMARNPDWQRDVLAKPYAERVALASTIRERSSTEKATKPEDIMDVAPASVDAAFREHGYLRMIHGHTHRPQTHVHQVDGHACTRVVLADWHDTAMPLYIGADLAMQS